MDAKVDGEQVILDLTKDEALVLFEWLHDVIASGADETVTSGLLEVLEETLHEPFDDNYDVLLEAARARLNPAE